MNEYLVMHDKGMIPPIGYGTWQLKGKNITTEDAVKFAINTGYRLIDTASIYGNEESVGKGIEESGIDRDALFVTTKLWNDDLGYDSAFKALNRSLTNLGLDYVDLYLIHWPNSELHHDAWRALIELKEQGKTRHIGVSNFTVRHLKELASKHKIKPVVNQIELHPGILNEQQNVLDYCSENDIVIEAYSPLAQAKYLDNQVLQDIAGKYNVSAAQVMIRWAVQHGAVPIPKSGNKNRIKTNLEVFDFELTNDEMIKINSIGSSERVTHDPAEHN